MRCHMLLPLLTPLLLLGAAPHAYAQAPAQSACLRASTSSDGVPSARAHAEAGVIWHRAKHWEDATRCFLEAQAMLEGLPPDPDIKATHALLAHELSRLILHMPDAILRQYAESLIFLPVAFGEPHKLDKKTRQAASLRYELESYTWDPTPQRLEKLSAAAQARIKDKKKAQQRCKKE